MRLADLNPSIQFILIGLLAVASAVLLVRAMVFIYREKIGFRPNYPKTWSAAQCRALERFRVLVGLGLIPLWGSFLFIAQWPFEFWDLFYFILLLLISSAWVRLLDRRNWKKNRGHSGRRSPSLWFGGARYSLQQSGCSCHQFYQNCRTALAHKLRWLVVQIRDLPVRRPMAIGELMLLEYTGTSGRPAYPYPTPPAPPQMLPRVLASQPTRD